MDLNTKVKEGLIAGLIAGIAMDSLEYVSYRIFRQPKVSSRDWLWIITTGHTPSPSRQDFLGYAGHMLFTAALGGVFTLLLPEGMEEKPVPRGLFWSVSLWAVSQVLAIVSRLPLLSKLPLVVRAQHLILASVYGIAWGASLRCMEKHGIRW